MTIEVRPASVYADVAELVGPKQSPDANVCWCLSYRVPNKVNRELTGKARGAYVRELTQRPVAPGVLAYRDDEVVGWAAVAPRADTSFTNSRRIPHIDEADVWSIWCIRVRPGSRGEGISHTLLEGAVDFARGHGAPAVEGYPVRNGSKKVNQTMAYVGTESLFEGAGFEVAAETDSVIDGMPRLLMRRPL